MFDKVPHDFIKLLDKAAKNAKPDSATVYIAKTFPAWKIRVLDVLRKHYEAGVRFKSQEEMKQDPAAAEQWKSIITELNKDESLNEFRKHVGPFVAFRKDEVVAFGEEALSATCAFDELKLLSEHVDYLKDKLGTTVKVGEAVKPEKGHEDAASNAQPGKPSIYFLIPAGAKAVPKAKGSGGGGTAKAVVKGAEGKKASNVPVLTDMAKLNEHLSDKSYIENGAAPTAADAAQFEAMPKTFDEAKFPHVKRWNLHIGHFTLKQRSRF